MVVAEVAAEVPAAFAAWDVARELVVVAAPPVFPAAERVDVGAPGVAAGRVAPAAGPADAGESAVVAAPVSRA